MTHSLIYGMVRNEFVDNRIRQKKEEEVMMFNMLNNNEKIYPSKFVPKLTSAEILEIKKGWSDKKSQDNKMSRSKKFYCVIISCDEHDALMLSFLFYCNFASRSSCYYGDNELSLYCGGAGSGTIDLMYRIRTMAYGYFVGKCCTKSKKIKRKHNNDYNYRRGSNPWNRLDNFSG